MYKGLYLANPKKRLCKNFHQAVFIIRNRPFMLLITHDGTSHYDEILATAVHQKIYPDSKLIRTRDHNTIETGDIVYDAGRVFNPKNKDLTIIRRLSKKLSQISILSN